MPYRAPDTENPRVRRTRDRMLAAARELLAETGPAGLTYSVLAERAGVTRQTLYRHWPTRSALLVDMILVGNDGYPEPGADPAAVAAAWLASLREGLSDPARRAAVLAVTAQADTDPDSAQALADLNADRLAALNELLRAVGRPGHAGRVPAALRPGARQDLLRARRGDRRVHRPGRRPVARRP